MAADNQDFGTPSPAGSGGVGFLLRDARRKAGHELKAVATALRIRQPYLEAIEEGRFEDLPGATYAVGFVRAYGEYLGLDGNEVVRRFKQETGDFAGRTELVFPSADSEGSIPTGALLAIAVVAAGIAYGSWYWHQSRQTSLAEAVPALPERLAALIHRPVGNGTEVVPVAPAEDGRSADATSQSPAAAPAPVAANPAPAPVAAPQHDEVVPPAEEEGGAGAAAQQTQAAADAAPAGAAPADHAVASNSSPANPAPAGMSKSTGGSAGNSPVTPASAPAVAEPAALASAAPAAAGPAAMASAVPAAAESKADAARARAEASANPAPLPEPPPAVQESGRVVLHAEENCWIEIRDANGRVVSSRLLHKGGAYTVPSRPGLKLTAGNAGVLLVEVAGKSMAPLGAVGVVRRDVSLDAIRADGLPPGGAGDNAQPAGGATPAPAGGGQPE